MFRWLKSILRGNQYTNEYLNRLTKGLSSRSEDFCEIFPKFRYFRVVGPTKINLQYFDSDFGVLVFRVLGFWGFGVWGFGGSVH